MEPRAALQRAAEELARQRAEIAALRHEKAEAIAVVGMACRLPGADTTAEYWDLLDRGGDAVTEVPRERWNAAAYYDADPSAVGKMTTMQGAFIRNADRFDAAFFGIAPREAHSLDPQQRLLLEVTWEALEHANIAPSSLYGSATGVFVGITCFDHAIRLSQSTANFNSYAGTGSALNMAPGRVSYVLGLTGPSLAVDTACSSSLVCLHLACQSLRLRESDAALVGGVHLILSPEVMVSFSQARMLAADGRSKTFDASADGYSRGEGCGVVVLKRVSDAIASHDNILGLIRGTAVNQDGPSGGLTVPNGAAQRQVIARAVAAAGVDPADVSYVEAHGTGTPLGDPIEVEALAHVYRAGRPPADPLLIGSAKTNIGHLEPAAGMAGLIKILLAFEHGRIPRHLHFRTPNPHIAWDEVPIRVVAEPVEWPRTDRPRLAGVSAFGFSGTNAHAIIAEPPPRQPPAASTNDERRLLVLSAKSDAALRALAARYVDMLATSRDPLASICYAAGAGRTHFAHRLATFATTSGGARVALGSFLRGEASPAWRTGTAAHAAYRCDASAVATRLTQAYAQRDLDDIASLYLEGVAIEWDQLYAAEVRRDAALPTYPFQRQRYWIEARDQPTDGSGLLQACLYHIVWEKQPQAAAGALDSERRWAIVPGDALLSAQLMRQLAVEGARGSLVAAVDAARAGATDIIYTTGARTPLASIGACVELLGLSQTLLAVRGVKPRIWIVTRGATPALGAMDEAGAAHAPLAAFARGLRLEHPELAGRVIDLQATAGTGDAAMLLEELLRDGNDDQIAIRGGERYAPRIDRARDVAGLTTAMRPDATYLITGGLGRLGLHTARWLSGRGARRLCLLGRTGVTTAEQRAQISACEAQGTRVRIATGDVADGDGVAALVRDLGSDAPLRGIVHAAGVAGWTDLADLSGDVLAAVLRPKIAGAWALHEATREATLDFFVCFSSIAAAWGSRGQAHYAAGNAFLDALAHSRRREGRPGVSIDWGPWLDGGMGAPEAEGLLRRVGVRPLSTGTALAALDALATGHQPQLIVADIDWRLFKGSYEARGHRPLLERMEGSVPDPPTAASGETALQRRLTLATASDRERLLCAELQSEVAAVLGSPSGSRPPLEQGLFELGLDSLMALELRTRLQTQLGRELPATLVFDCPTISAIARFLLTAATPTPALTTAAPPPMVATRAEVDALTDAEAEVLLLRRLDSIH